MANAKIEITTAAAKQILELLKNEVPGSFLRIDVTGGGCSGFKYNFTFDTAKNGEDVSFTQHGANVVVDVISLGILDGSELDYVTEMMGASFIMRNPNAAASCGCGSSFSI